jgi:hypothetical protein
VNPLDFSVWSELERLACKSPHANINDLKASLKKAWAKLSKEYIEKTCSSFRGRIEAVIEANGGHIE